MKKILPVGTIASTHAQPQAWHDHEVVTFAGSHDSNIGRGRDYKTRTLLSIFEGDAPACVEKEKAPAFIPSGYCKFDARGFAVQREHGSYVCITGDIDSGNHDLVEVADLVEVFAGRGTAFIVYSTAGATFENQKWRILIPLAAAVPYQAWNDLQWALIRWMGSDDVELDTALAGSAQAVFLQNVPPGKRDENGKPIFHQSHAVEGTGFELQNSEVAAQWLEAAEAERVAAEAESARAHAASKVKAAKRAASGDQGPIARFNDEHDIDELLAKYGYTSAPGGHWRSPMQTSAGFATWVMGQHWTSMSGSDLAAGLGSETKSGHCHGDAFDLFVFFEHKGDRNAALKAYSPLSPRRGAQPAPNPETPPEGPSSPDNGQGDGQADADGDALAPHLSEIALSEAFAAAAAGRFRWTPGLDWMMNQGSYWVRDVKLQRFTLSKSICKDAAAPVERAQLQAKIASSSTANAVLSLARSEADMVTDVSEWDAHPMLLNTPGDVYDLTTGQPVSRDGLLFMQVAGVSPTRTATPAWDKFISEIFGGDLAMVDFVKRMGGYALTGSVKEQKLFYLHGEGSNGKSLFLEVLRSVAGAYAHNLPSEALMTAKHERHPTTFAALQGKRLAVSSEIEDGAHWAESKIKSLTGDATMTARFMRGDDFEFSVTHKHILAGNFKPRLKGDDFAMIRRMVLIPFNQTFKGERADAGLKDKLAAEHPGILQWFIDGAQAWFETGLKIPAQVLDSSKAYMAEQDDIALWLDECCEVGLTFSDSNKSLYASYSDWKTEQGEKPQSAKTWSERLLKSNSRFVRVQRVNGSRDRGFAGLKLASATQRNT